MSDGVAYTFYIPNSDFSPFCGKYRPSSLSVVCHTSAIQRSSTLYSEDIDRNCVFICPSHSNEFLMCPKVTGSGSGWGQGGCVPPKIFSEECPSKTEKKNQEKQQNHPQAVNRWFFRRRGMNNFLNPQFFITISRQIFKLLPPQVTMMQRDGKLQLSLSYCQQNPLNRFLFDYVPSIL